jgi:hypothetical protein
MFMARAVAARADFLVTGNNRHFPNASHGSAKLVDARESLERITLDG